MIWNSDWHFEKKIATNCCAVFAGISVSSLSDGVFVLHVPSEDNKQKVKMRTPNCFAAVLKKEKKKSHRKN